MAQQQISTSLKKPKRLLETDEFGEVLYGPATPPVKGVDSKIISAKGHSLRFVMDSAWRWRNRNVKPEVEIPVRVPTVSELKAMEKVAPHSAAIYRQQIAETIEGNKRIKLTRTIARIQKLIVDQYGRPKPEENLVATDSITWLNSAAMANRLGISTRTLFKYQNNGFLIEGRHFQRSTPAPKSPWVWDADLTLKAWNAEVQS